MMMVCRSRHPIIWLMIMLLSMIPLVRSDLDHLIRANLNHIIEMTQQQQQQQQEEEEEDSLLKQDFKVKEIIMTTTDDEKDRKERYRSFLLEFKQGKTIRFTLPSLLLDMSAERMQDELVYHNRHDRWSQRVILEMFYQALSPKQESDQQKRKSARWQQVRNYPKQREMKNWMDDDVDVCLWDGITCGIITAGSGLARSTSTSGVPIIYSNVNCWCLEPWEDAEWDWPTEEDVNMLEMFGTGELAEREEKRLNKARETEEEKAMIDRLLYAELDEEHLKNGLKESDIPDPERLKKDPILLNKLKRFRDTLKMACSCPDHTIPRTYPPKNAVTKIDLIEFGITGTLPTELSQLRFLHRLNFNSNNLYGTIPTELGLFENLHFLDLGENNLTGKIPKELALLNNTIDELWLEKNYFTGSFPEELTSLNAEFIDVNGNSLTGSIPTKIGSLPKIVTIYLQDNGFTGTIPTEIGDIDRLKAIDISGNSISGPIPSELGLCPLLMTVDFSNNKLTGTLPKEILSLDRLLSLNLRNNELTGPLPTLYLPESEASARFEFKIMSISNMLTMSEDIIDSDDSGSDSDSDSDDEWTGYSWASLSEIAEIDFGGNKFSGSIPSSIFNPNLRNLDLSRNNLTGTIPLEIKFAEKIEKINLSSNSMTGTIPEFSQNLKALSAINLIRNKFTGSVPQTLCSYYASNKLKNSVFGCDAVLCPPRTFHYNGVASDVIACAPCPSCAGDVDRENQPSCFFLGQTKCEDSQHKGFMGDIDGDGALSIREILYLIYALAGGERWGKLFEEWDDLNVHECDLIGVVCENSLVTKLDFRGAAICQDYIGARCDILPQEIGLIDSLEVLNVSNSVFSRFTIPTHIGLLTNLKILDLSKNSQLNGEIPSEIGNCKNLVNLNLSQGQLRGTIPDTIGDLTLLEQINLSQNTLKTQIPSSIGNLSRLNVLIFSRLGLYGTIPKEIGNLSILENLELYGNTLSGSIPSSLGKCTHLKRIDMFNNLLTGTMPDLSNLQVLQIVHFKANHLEGTIPEFFGKLPHLTWLDISLNRFFGTIPSSLGQSESLEVLRLGDNLLQGPIPSVLCKNPNINGGLFQKYGCDFIVCPLRTYSELGFASDTSPCTICPDGFTTVSIGSTYCRILTQRDFLTIFYDVMQGDDWPPEFEKTWKDPNQLECEWEGVTCDSNGDVVSLVFPMSVTSYSDLDKI